MIQTGTFYNPDADLHEVVINGFVNLQDAYLHNSVPANLQAQEGLQDDIHSAHGLLNRPRDVFEMMHTAQAISNYKPSQKGDGEHPE